MTINPNLIALTLVGFLSVSTTIFFFVVPPSLQNSEKTDTSENKEHNVLGAWGSPTSEIDWCEFNHNPSLLPFIPPSFNHYIAEPENTISSLYYVFLALAA